MSNLDDIIQTKVPILKFHEHARAFPISADTLLAESSIQGNTVTPPSVSMLELADFDPKAPVYVKYRRHDNVVDIQFLWFFYPSKFLDCTLEVGDGQITKIALMDKWFNIQDFQMREDGRPYIYVTSGGTLFPSADSIILASLQTTSSKGKELTSPAVLLGGNDYIIKSPHGIEGNPRLLSLEWNGKKMPAIPECKPPEDVPLNLGITTFYVLVFISIIIVALMTHQAKKAYHDYQSHRTHLLASKIMDSHQ